MKVSTYEVKLMSCFLVSYPLAGVLVCISSARHKNLLVIGISLFYLIGIFDLWSGLRTLMISSAGAYTIAKYISGSAMPWIGFVFLMAHLSISHVTKVPGTQGMSIVGAQMVTVIKLSSFCWNVHDGRQPDAELSQRQRQRAINTLPPLLEYAGYVLFFPTLFVGPAFDFAEYQRWLTRDQSMGSRQLLTAARKAAYGLLWTVAFYKVSRLYSPWILLSYEAMQRSILKRVWHMYVLGLSTRMRYYGFWNLVEGACIVSGISFNGVDLQTGHVRWDGMENAKPLKLEFAQAADVYVRNWNIHTHLWLRDYVYLRCPYPTSKKHPGFLARTISFIVSALWHGFNPGHYLSFIAAAVIQTIAKGNMIRLP
ncbi:Lysophospholipid acyltransferase [Neofusicoccum ribis]|uniref:Lysophospholipid acyltransferase n=1 Tax=Neofusicoccum ribis TaxID=45134 RepID=A0ABR3SNQ8_9PEZI